VSRPPIIPDFNARAGAANYPALWQAATPQGISGATIQRHRSMTASHQYF
jgi:hypothetical protein